MCSFYPENLSVMFLPPTNSYQPLIGRKYTLTHSDQTGELFLDIGCVFSYWKINRMRDEVLAEWKRSNENLWHLLGTVYVDGGEYSRERAMLRYNIFKRELETALTAIAYGDAFFFFHYPALLDSPIYIFFQSTYPEYKQMLFFGTPRDYLKGTSLA